jgi:hypothetical protein
MQIVFGDDAGGFREARTFYRLLRQAQDLDPVDSGAIQLLDSLRAATEAHLARPEFAALEERAEELDDAAPAPATAGSLWRRWLGPSRREQMLSAQRSAALERAERAERSAFEALAETARVARERDAALARVGDLEARLAAAGGSPA